MKNKRISIMISRNKNRYLFVSAAKIDKIKITLLKILSLKFNHFTGLEENVR